MHGVSAIFTLQILAVAPLTNPEPGVLADQAVCREMEDRGRAHFTDTKNRSAVVFFDRVPLPKHSIGSTPPRGVALVQRSRLGLGCGRGRDHRPQGEGTVATTPAPQSLKYFMEHAKPQDR